MSIAANPKPRRRLWRYLAYAALAVGAVLGGLAWYATTPSFQSMVRRRLTAELEKMTGGRVELGNFHAVPFHFEVSVTNLTIHGKEAAGDVPYAHADRLSAKIKIISVLGAELGFDEVVLDHPVVHIILYPDGSTNQPEPGVKATSSKTPVEQVFDLSIGHFLVQRGEVIWDNQHIPLEFAANDVVVSMSYSFFRRRYQSRIAVGKVDTRFQDFRPFAWRAEADFSLGRDAIEVSSLKWSSGRSEVEASGEIVGFHSPKITARYSATLDLGNASVIARRSEVRSGMLEGKGKGSWSASAFEAEGKLALRALEWQDDHLALRDVSLDSAFWLNQQRLRLTKLEARLLGGTAAGDLEISNWLSPEAGTSTRKEPKGAKAAELPEGLVRLRWKGVSVNAVDAALSRWIPSLARETLAGTAGGSLDLHWKQRLRDAEAKLALEVVPAPKPSALEVPVTLSAHATYQGPSDELDVADFSASTRATQMRASGRLSQNSNLKISVSATSFDEWQPVIAAVSGASGLPVALHGATTFEGAVTGPVSAPVIAGNLHAEDFDLLLPATGRAPERPLHGDSLTTGVKVSSRALTVQNALLEHGDAEVRLDFSAAFIQGRFSDDSPITGHAAIHNGDVADVQKLAGYDYPLSGRVDLELQASGTKGDPQGHGNFSLTQVVAYGQSVPRIAGEFSVAERQIELKNLHAEQDTARVNGEGSYDFDSGTFQARLAGSGFDLGRVERLQSNRLSIGGRAEFTAAGSGTLEQPVIHAELALRDLTLDKEKAGDFHLTADTRGRDLHLTGRSQFQEADLTLDGNVSLQHDFPADLVLRFHHMDVDYLVRSFTTLRVTGHSALAGELHVQGPLRSPRDLDATASLEGLQAEIENIKVASAGPIRLTLSREVLTLEPIHLVGDLTDFTARGTVQLGGERRLNLRADGRVNLKLVQTLDSDFVSSGSLAVELAVNGTMNEPAFRGRVKVSDGALSVEDVPNGLSALNGSLVFNQNRLQIENLTARTGGGTLSLGGSISYYRHQFSVDLNAQGQDIRLRYPPGVSSQASANLRLVGTTAAATLSGDITVNRVSVTPGFDFAAYMENSKQAVSGPASRSLLNNVRLDIHVTTATDLQMQTVNARLVGDADLRLRGSAARPALLGRVDIVEGELSMNGVKFRLDRGDIIFTNPVSIQPVLDLQASTRVSDYDINVGVSGTTEKLSLTYRSEPPLPDADIIALLAMGRTREESAALQSSGGLSQDASNLILSQALNSVVSNRAEHLFGVSRIKVDPQGLGTETSTINRGPLVTIEQQVYDNLTVTYSTTVSQTSEQIIQVQYNLSRNVSIVALRDYNGVVSIDVKVRKRKK